MKTVLSFLAVATMLAASAGGLYAFTCKVESVEGSRVVIKCSLKDVKDVKPGQEARIVKKVEGC